MTPGITDFDLLKHEKKNKYDLLKHEKIRKLVCLLKMHLKLNMRQTKKVIAKQAVGDSLIAIFFLLNFVPNARN